MKYNFLAVTCPNCGHFVDIPIDDIEGLHIGLTVSCPRCEQDIVFLLMTNEEYMQLCKTREATP